MVEGYCAKCKTRKAIADGVGETMKNGRVVHKGKCESCGAEMLKIIGDPGNGGEGPETGSATTGPAGDASD